MKRIPVGGRAALIAFCFACILGLVTLIAGCGGNGGSTGDNNNGNDAAVNDDALVDGDGNVIHVDASTIDASPTTYQCRVTDCQTHTYQCGDCIDNDGDGLTDSQDPDCLGVCDNNEGGFNTEIPGGNAAPCKQDCYFDQDTGAGNDDCYWDHLCDPYEPLELNPCNYNQTCTNCDCQGWLDAQSQTCLDFCLPMVPNGCDCFGCCEFVPESGEYFFIGSPGCNLDNPGNCSRCTPVPSCLNECGECEICLGRTELPPECDEQYCPPGVQQCDQPGDDPCPVGFYCVTGCCAPIVS